MRHHRVYIIPKAITSALIHRLSFMLNTSLRDRLETLFSGLRNAWPGTSLYAQSSGKELNAVLKAARSFSDPAADAELMPLRSLLRSHRGALPESLAPSMERFENRLVRDEERLEQLRECESHLLESTDSQVDVAAHFEELTGHRLADVPTVPNRKASKRGALKRRNRVRPSSRLPIARMRAGSAVLASVMLVFVVTLGSWDNDPLSDAIGVAVKSESVLFGNLGETSRGGSDAQAEKRRGQIKAALDRIDDARTSILGFHTGYDPTALREAAALIEQAAWSTSPVEPGTLELYRLRDEILDVIGETRQAESAGADLNTVQPGS